MTAPLVTSTNAIDFYTELDNMGIHIWVDGGWSVDALLGEQTRPHADLDIVIEQKDLHKVVDLLINRGYKDVDRDDTCPWNFVLGNDKGNEIDFHVIVLDDDGNGIYGPSEVDFFYPAEALRGEGRINGYPVRCISADYSVKFHTGYKPQEKDFMDVSGLCLRFGIEYPEEYTHLR